MEGIEAHAVFEKRRNTTCLAMSWKNGTGADGITVQLECPQDSQWSTAVSFVSPRLFVTD